VSSYRELSSLSPDPLRAAEVLRAEAIIMALVTVEGGLTTLSY
jgi:hypothetical protein